MRCSRINQSTNVLVFETYSGETDRLGGLCYNDLTQMTKFLTQIPDCDCHSSTLFGLFISSDAILCSTMFYNPSIEKFWSCCFLSFFWLSVKLKAGCPISFHSFLLFLCWLGRLFDYLRISLNSVLLLLLVNFVSGFKLELMYISLIISERSNFTHFSCFLAACTTVIVQRKHFFCLYQQNKSSES